MSGDGQLPPWTAYNCPGCGSGMTTRTQPAMPRLCDICATWMKADTASPPRKLTDAELREQLDLEWGDRGAIVVDRDSLPRHCVVELWRGKQGERSAHWTCARTLRQALAQALAFAMGAA